MNFGEFAENKLSFLYSEKYLSFAGTLRKVLKIGNLVTYLISKINENLF